MPVGYRRMCLLATGALMESFSWAELYEADPSPSDLMLNVASLGTPGTGPQNHRRSAGVTPLLGVWQHKVKSCLLERLCNAMQCTQVSCQRAGAEHPAGLARPPLVSLETNQGQGETDCGGGWSKSLS